MSENAEQIIVLKDGAGNYYEIPRTALESYLVPENRVAEVEAALLELHILTGYINAPSLPGSIVGTVGEEGRGLYCAGVYLSGSES